MSFGEKKKRKRANARTAKGPAVRKKRNKKKKKGSKLESGPKKKKKRGGRKKKVRGVVGQKRGKEISRNGFAAQKGKRKKSYKSRKGKRASYGNREARSAREKKRKKGKEFPLEGKNIGSTPDRKRGKGPTGLPAEEEGKKRVLAARTGGEKSTICPREKLSTPPTQRKRVPCKSLKKRGGKKEGGEL